jgi:hypothetical protein
MGVVVQAGFLQELLGAGLDQLRVQVGELVLSSSIAPSSASIARNRATSTSRSSARRREANSTI